MSYIQLKCRSFRVGSYKYVDNVLTNGINFQAYVLEDGILFRMPHLQRRECFYFHVVGESYKYLEVEMFFVGMF